MIDNADVKRCGYVAIVGRPNVGKSTLLNHILGQKLSITSRKPQTTRHTLLGIKTEGDSQVIYVDTPGIHKDEPRAINRYMNRSATSVINDVDVIVFVIERLNWSPEDEVVLERIMNARAPVILAVNKVDQLDDKTKLLPFLEEVSGKAEFASIIPLSALRQDNLDQLELAISQFIPENIHFFPEDQITDRTERFLGAEIVREKIMRQLGHELPYQVTVEIEQFAEENGVLHIGAVILVERDSQKAIVIGKGGTKMRTIGREARLDMESLFDQKVMLNLWVKVKRGWSDDERALRSLGYDEF
jgi:GTP-binding protein Era